MAMPLIDDQSLDHVFYPDGALEIWVREADGLRACTVAPTRGSSTQSGSPECRSLVIRVHDWGGTHTIHVMSALHGSPANEPVVAPANQTIAANPLLDAFRMAIVLGTDIDGIRTEAIARFGFAIPSDEALDAIERCSPDGVVEVGAGTGYWASLLQQRGVDVVAFDIEPAPSPQNTWFAGTPPWHPVHRGDHDIVGEHPERTLLIVWPTKNETWAATAVERYHDAGGQRLVFVGEGPGGRTGDATFHAMLGELSSCVQCEYGSMTSPCICGVGARWHRTETIGLPHWPGFYDDLHVYAREAPVEGGKRRRRSRGRRTGPG